MTNRKHKKTETISFRLAKWLLRKLKAEAKREGRSMSEIIHRILEWWYLEKEEKE